VYEQLGVIETPTLIIVGEEDTATTPGKAQRMHEKIAGSKLVVIPQAGHSSSIEQPDAVNREIVTFLSGLS
jgi:pimeloyl-ACP methyl ester carboxylesterase